MPLVNAGRGGFLTTKAKEGARGLSASGLFSNTPKNSLEFVVELRNLARGRLDRHAQVERMCQLTAHRCCFTERSRTSHSLAVNERVIASFLLLISNNFYSRRCSNNN